MVPPKFSAVVRPFPRRLHLPDVQRPARRRPDRQGQNPSRPPPPPPPPLSAARKGEEDAHPVVGATERPRRVGDGTHVGGQPPLAGAPAFPTGGPGGILAPVLVPPVDTVAIAGRGGGGSRTGRGEEKGRGRSRREAQSGGVPPLVLPVGRNAEFCQTVHLRGADLHFVGPVYPVSFHASGVVQALVSVWLRRGYIVLGPSHVRTGKFFHAETLDVVAQGTSPLPEELRRLIHTDGFWCDDHAQSKHVRNIEDAEAGNHPPLVLNHLFPQ
mmetsp:Transcript_24880/g.38532  ORF Transcript_24880/g.38532 Transcript_24880/m.38532 type:complete len:270 (-) Transcript_24880:387-1196(-)